MRIFQIEDACGLFSWFPTKSDGFPTGSGKCHQN
jgi:hypothetical protein